MIAIKLKNCFFASQIPILSQILVLKIRKIGFSQKAAIEIFGLDLISTGFELFKMGDTVLYLAHFSMTNQSWRALWVSYMGRYAQKRSQNDRLLKKGGLAATVILDINAVFSFFRTSFVGWRKAKWPRTSWTPFTWDSNIWPRVPATCRR